MLLRLAGRSIHLRQLVLLRLGGGCALLGSVYICEDRRGDEKDTAQNGVGLHDEEKANAGNEKEHSACDWRRQGEQRPSEAHYDEQKSNEAM